MKRTLTREYLEEALKLARRDLPGWAFAMIQSEARARAGGRSKHRTDEPGPLEKLALVEIKPAKLRDVDDEDLRAIWLRLHQWYANAKKQKRAVENIVNAALWTEEEMKRRRFRVGESELTREIDKLQAVRKDDGIFGLLKNAPKELVAVKNFVCVVGSTAKGKENPADLDVLIRAVSKDEQFHIQSENIWLPIRNALDPKKTDRLHFIDNPQGAHGDFIGAYDLVMRRKEDFKTEVVKASSTGLMAALWIPDEVGKKIAIRDGEAVDDLHCTLAYFGKVDDLPDGAADRCLQAVKQAIKGTSPLRGKIAGIGRFNASETSDGKDVVYASLDVPGLVSLRERIVAEAEKRGLHVSKKHDFTPHVTLAYVDKGAKEIPSVKSLSIEFDAVYVAAGEFRHKIRKAFEGEETKVDLGCGANKPAGYKGIDKQQANGVDVVHDLEQGIPLDDDSCDEVRANHCLEHMADKEQIMAEVHRVLKPGGRFVFEVPSTKGEGAFAHPDHKSYWNKSSFAFWAQDDLCEGRPKFTIEKLDEIEANDLVYVRGVLCKPESVAKAAFSPFTKFTPPKPQVAGFTELFEIEELWDWAEKRLPIAIEPKHNGFRGILESEGDRQRLWFEGTPDRDRMKALGVEAPSGEYVLDLDIAIERGGKRLARPDLMKLNADKPEFAPDERVVLTVFDAPYVGEDLTKQPFSERRKELERFFKKLGKQFKLSPLRWAKSLGEARVATRWAFGQDRSEGLVAKSADGTYALDGTTNEWSKLKRVAEIKVFVLDKKKTKKGENIYRGGLLLSSGDEGIYKNIVEFKGRKYVDLGWSFATSV